MKNKKGFTLIELLVVIAIIGLLSTLAIVSLNTARQKSRDTKRQADARTLQSAIELCINEGGTIPAVAATWPGMLADTCGSVTLGSFLSSGNMPIPPAGGTTCTATGPTGNCYSYCRDAAGTRYLLASVLEGTSSGGLTANLGYLAGECISVGSAGGNGSISTAAFAADKCAAGNYFCLGK
ncbi:MAG: type II secretion system protein [Patescibacteria group bacterium]|nr:type II secretion system protein [Patescibacteria group bacterium]